MLPPGLLCSFFANLGIPLVHSCAWGFIEI
jgi:hypothetical protein